MKKSLRYVAALLSMLVIIPTLFSCGYKSKYDAVMEYNGIKLTEEFYYYWMSTYKRNILSSYADASDTDEFWNLPYDDERTVEEYFTEIINEHIMNYLISQDLFKNNSLKLSDKTKKTISDDIDEKIDFYGGRSALNKTLSGLMLNIDSLEQVYLWEAKHDAVYNYLFGKGGALEVSDADLISYYEDNYYRIKYVVFYTTNIKTDANGDYVYDANGNLISEEMTEAEKEQKSKKIAEFEEKLNSGADFDSLISEYSEYDTKNYPNGFFLSVNELDIWGTDIYTAVKDSEESAVSRVEENEAIFYVKRLPLTDFEDLSDTDISQLTDLTSYATAGMYDKLFGELSEKVIVYSDVMNKYKLSEIKANPNYSI